MVIVTLADFVGSATEVAVRVTVAGLGTLAGARYVTELDVAFKSVPQVLPLQPLPDIAQVAPSLCTSFVSVATKFCDP